MVDWNCCNFDLFDIFLLAFVCVLGFFTFVITLFYAFGTFYPTFCPFRFPLIRFDTFFLISTFSFSRNYEFVLLWKSYQKNQKRFRRFQPLPPHSSLRHAQTHHFCAKKITFRFWHKTRGISLQKQKNTDESSKKIRRRTKIEE